MRPPDTIVIDGRAYSWRQLCTMRREQLDAWRAAQPRQLALFELKVDCRPAGERSAAVRFEQPSLLSLMHARRCDGT